MNIERLNAIADWLEGKPTTYSVPSKFNMRDGIRIFGTPDGSTREHIESQLSCKTAACIAGTACFMFNDVPALLAKSLDLTEVKDESYPLDWWDVSYEAMDLLDLNRQIADRLFAPHAYLEIIDAAWAARCIRNLVATGEVDWYGTMNAAPAEAQPA